MASLSQIRDVDSALEILDEWLCDRDYTPRSREGISAHIRQHGELLGTVPEFLDREDLETATAVFVTGLRDVPTTSTDWDDDGAVWSISDPAEVERLHVAKIDALIEEFDARDLAALGIAPMSGGAPYEPTEADLAEFAEWSAGLDGMAFPGACDASDRARFRADVADHYRDHPES